jgi:hypothetical protein
MDVPLSERMFRAFLEQMIRSEAVDPDDIEGAAERLDKAGDDEAAHALRCIALQAMVPDQSDWEADRRRNRFHVVEGDGGKSEA